MPNDDLGSFPMPQQTPSAPVEPVVADNVAPPPITSPIPSEEGSPQIEPIVSTTMENTSPATPPIISPETPTSEPQTPQFPTFEETPEEIPSQQISTILVDEHEKLAAANESMIEKQSPSLTSQPALQPEPVKPAETPPEAALPPKSRSLAPVIIVILLIVAGVGLAAAAYLSSQSNKLKTQLSEITQTLEKQKTILTPTVTPTVFQIPTPTTATQTAVIATSSATPTTTTIPINTEEILPLTNAAAVLKVAINHSPNAQLILIKVDNATDPSTVVTKYFFREDLTTKKYFFVSISSNGIPELIDKQIYVNPDNNIPSLNDAVLTNKMGMDLGETLKLTYTQCANQTACTSAPVKAMYINTSSGITWQLSLYTNGLSATPLLIQINAETKAIIYKSPEFANK